MHTEYDQASWLERQGLDGATAGLCDGGESQAARVERMADELIEAAQPQYPGRNYTSDTLALRLAGELGGSYGVTEFAADSEGAAKYELGADVRDKLAEIRETLASDGPLTLDYARDCLAWIARQAGDDDARGLIENRLGRETYKLPACWASALFNGDESGLDGEELDALHRWLAWFEEGRPGGWQAADVGESYYSNNHEADQFTSWQAGDVADFTFIGKPVD